MIPYWEPPTFNLFGLEVAGFGLMVGLGLMVGITLSRRQVAAHRYDPEPFWEVLILVVFCVVGWATCCGLGCWGQSSAFTV